MLHTKSKATGLLVLEKKILEGFYHIWAWRPSWSFDQDRLNKLSFPHPMKSPYEILRSIGLVVSEMFENVDRRTEGRRKNAGVTGILLALP